MRIALIILFLFFSHLSQAQIGLSKRALHRFEKGKVDKAMELVNKALDKDSTLALPYYVKALILFQPDYSYYNLDSAYNFIQLGRQQFPQMEGRDRANHERAGIDSLKLVSLKQEIDSAAYERAVTQNTEAGFIYFLEKYPTAVQSDKAVVKRNALAFAGTLETDTYQSYQDFIKKYPDAIQVKEARFRYEKLYFDEKTGDQKLTSYINFLEEHPQTPYRLEAEKQIYEIATASNKPQTYLDFVKRYPKSKLRHKSLSFLYHILKEKNQKFPNEYLTDSLKNILRLENKVLFPIMEGKMYGFMDSEGQVIINPSFSTISDEEICGGITHDFLFADHKIIGLDKSIIADVTYDEVENMGYGLLRVRLNDKMGVLHKSGIEILPLEYENVRLMKGTFLAYKFKGSWGLATFSGRNLLDPLFDEISWMGDLIIFEKGNKFDIKTKDQMLALADDEPLDFDFKYADYEIINSSNIWLKSGDNESIADSDLNEILPMTSQQIKVLKRGFYVSTENGFYILDTVYRPLHRAPSKNVLMNESWVGLGNGDNWSLYNMEDYRLRSEFLDSVRMVGNHFVLVVRNDSSAIMTAERSVIMEENDKISLIPALNSSEYILIEKKRNKLIINTKGEAIYNGPVEDAKPLADDYIVLSDKNGKKGMVSTNGESLLPFEYDAIGNFNKGYVSLLKNKKFGLYNQKRSVMIPANYEKNILYYNDSLFITQKGGLVGLIDENNKNIMPFDYEDIEYWNDTVALAKSNFRWLLYNLNKGKIIEEGLKSIHFIRQDKGEVVAIILKDTGYGVYSSAFGKIVPPTYNDIVNVGTFNKPVYFTEKHIAEAGYYVVIYYDDRGNILFKQPYDEDEYSKIYCEN